MSSLGACGCWDVLGRNLGSMGYFTYLYPRIHVNDYKWGIFRKNRPKVNDVPFFPRWDMLTPPKKN